MSGLIVLLIIVFFHHFASKEHEVTERRELDEYD